MIPRAIWCKWALVNISKTTNCTRTMGSCNFEVFDMALEIMLLLLITCVNDKSVPTTVP